MSTPFWCSKCKFVHPGECKDQSTVVSIPGPLAQPKVKTARTKVYKNHVVTGWNFDIKRPDIDSRLNHNALVCSRNELKSVLWQGDYKGSLKITPCMYA